MRKFIKELAAGVLIVLLISYALQYVIDLRIKGKAVNGPDNLDCVKGQYNDIVFLGSSRCVVHFDPSLFLRFQGMKAVNLGVDGHKELSMPILRLKDYLAKNKAPRFVILSFDPLAYPGSFTSNANFLHKDCFARYAFLCSEADKPFVEYFKFNFAERYIPLYAVLRYQQFVDCLTLSNVDNWVRYGYLRHDENWDTVSHPINKKIVATYFDTSSSNLEGIKARLKEISLLCDQHNSKFICVQTPIYKEVYNGEQFNLTGRICTDLKIPFFDLNRDSIDNDINCFYNIDHLNTRGVRKMTNFLLANSDFQHLLGVPGQRN